MMGFFGRVKEKVSAAKEKYAAAAEKREEARTVRAEKDAKRYAVLAKAERERAAFERAKTATAKARASRSKMSGAGFGSNPLLSLGGSGMSGKSPLAGKTVSSAKKQKYFVSGGKAYPVVGSSPAKKKSAKTARREKSIFERMEELM